MENSIEKNKEMTAEESLSLITETLNNSRKEITRRSGKYYILWGILLTVFSVVVYALWKMTDKEAWNCLWFAMPVSIGRVIRVMVLIGSLTAELVLIFGLAECACGVALKNWVMKIAGFVTGIGGLAIYYITGACEEQIFIFTFAGLVLIVTGLVVKHQYK